MKKIVLVFITLILIISIGITGCEKNNDYSLEGKWKLSMATFSVGGYLYFLPIDSSNNNIIYEFQKNNKLLVTSSISGSSQIRKYSYKCKGRKTPSYTEGYHSIQVIIDKDICYGTIGHNRERLLLFRDSNVPKTSVKPQKPIDEIDLILMEQDSLSFWQKDFKKIK